MRKMKAMCEAAWWVPLMSPMKTQRSRKWVHLLTGNSILLWNNRLHSPNLRRRCWYMLISLFPLPTNFMLSASHPPKQTHLWLQQWDNPQLFKALEPSCNLFRENTVAEVEKHFPGSWMVCHQSRCLGHKSCCARAEHPIIHVTGTVVYSLGYYYYLVYVCDMQGSGQEPFVPGAKGITGPFPFGQTYS